MSDPAQSDSTRKDAPPAALLWAVHGAELEPLRPPAGAGDLHALFDGLSAGVYEGFRTFAGDRFLGLPHHLDRALSSIERAGLDFELDPEALTAAIGQAAQEAPWEETRFRFDVLAQPATELGTEARVILGAVPLHPAPPSLRADGVAVATTRAMTRTTPLVKTRAWAEERRALEGEGFYEHVLLDGDDLLLECASSNLFLVRGGVVYTAGQGILLGVTRALVLRLCAEEGLPVRRLALPLGELETVDEAFLTSASRGLVPVVRVDDRTIGDGVPGPVTRRLLTAYDLHVEKHARRVRR